MNVHFIAIGGSAMHNLAIALHNKGYTITGSDDQVFEPSRTRLQKVGLLPLKDGWNTDNIHPELDAIILGMHARIDNPELLKAQELGIKIYSYPEYLYEQTKHKKRVVIGGSHGKTTITSMIMHVLKYNKKQFDYMVGAQIEGFETMVHLSNDNDIAIFEGDEYLSSPIDPRPKFHWYKPHLAVLSGIAWDHINVFPTFENYVEQFAVFTSMIEPNGKLFYFEADSELKKVAGNVANDIEALAYSTADHIIRNGKTFIVKDKKEWPISVFGKHNLQNISAAYLIVSNLGLTDEEIFGALNTFSGAQKRLQVLANTYATTIFLDFAHSPSKLKATTQAVSEQYSDRELIACMELHTFSSLKKDFLPEYEDTMKSAQKAFVYFNPDVVKHKRLEPITKEDVKKAFGSENVEVFDNSDQLVQTLGTLNLHKKNLLLMSSGNFNGINFVEFAQKLIGKTKS